MIFSVGMVTFDTNFQTIILYDVGIAMFENVVLDQLLFSALDLKIWSKTGKL